jgi:hypothetical protein
MKGDTQTARLSRTPPLIFSPQNKKSSLKIKKFTMGWSETRIKEALYIYCIYIYLFIYYVRTTFFGESVEIQENTLSFTLERSRNSVGGTATGYGLDDQEVGF